MMKLKRVLSVGIAAIGLAAGGVLVPAAPASAAKSDCPAGYLCLWTGENFTGAMAQFQIGDADLGSAPGPTGMNNAATSVWNRTGDSWCLYNYVGYSGILLWVPAGSSQDLMGPDDNNKTTSLKKTAPANC